MPTRGHRKDMDKATVLIVDDEVAIRDMVGITLGLAGFRCIRAADARAAHIAIVDQKPDLVLLDWMLPGGSGLELARQLRREELTAALPIIMLTARTSEDNKVQGLDAGADDYITKPFSRRELVARIKTVLRRSGGDREQVLQVQGLTLDPASHRTAIDGQPLALGPTEFRLLRFFMQNQDKVFSRRRIQDAVWGGNVYVDERTVDVHIRRLRKALSSVQSTGLDYSKLVQTVRGSGYRFSPRLS